jgi:hypothetical protein
VAETLEGDADVDGLSAVEGGDDLTACLVGDLCDSCLDVLVPAVIANPLRAEGMQRPQLVGGVADLAIPRKGNGLILSLNLFHLNYQITSRLSTNNIDIVHLISFRMIDRLH